MPIPVACQCGAKFAAQDRLAGKAVKCPKCGQPIQIPAVDAGTAPPATPKTTPPKKPAAPAVPPVDSGVGSILDEFGLEASKTGVKCPSCGAPMKPDAILCIQCGYNTKTGQKLETVSDTEADRRREAVYAQQAAAAEKRGKRHKASSGYGGGGGGYSGPDDDLTGLEYVACFCCSGITCIIGVVYLATGNPKGPKLIMWSVIFAVLKNVIGLAIQAGTGGLQQ